MGKAMLRLENALYALACRCLELEKYDSNLSPPCAYAVSFPITTASIFF